MVNIWVQFLCVSLVTVVNGFRSSRSFIPLRRNYLSMNLMNQPGNLMTLSRFMIEATRSNPDHADFESLMISIQLACKTIAQHLSRSNIFDLTGVDANTDASGKHLEPYELASYALKNSLRFTGKIGVIASEADEHPVIVEESWNSKYIAVFDPLDGFDNINANVVTGTIFSIYKESEDCLQDFGENIGSESEKLLLKNLKHENLVASGYCMYSASTMMMFTMGGGVNGFTLDPTIGEFVLTAPNIKVPTRGAYYSINEGHHYDWCNGLQKYVNIIKRGTGEFKKPYSHRYIGSLVGDVHRTLLYGGIFAYPADVNRPKGKLRLLHEVRPMAFLIEQAGGKASTGYGPISKVQVETLNERSSVFLGSHDDIVEAEAYLRTDIE